MGAGATVYSEHTNMNSYLTYVRDPFVEVLLKEKLIDNAKKEIWIMQHEHQPDYTGTRLIIKLKNAVKRGVKVRYLYEKTATIAGGDLFSKSQDLLLASDGGPIPSIINLGFVNRLLSPIPFSNLLHAKFLIIDPGTPNEIIYFGGRNTGDKYMEWFDAGFALKPIDFTKKHIGNDIVAYFNNYWTLLKKNGFTEEAAVKLTPELKDKMLKANNSFANWKLPESYYLEAEKIFESFYDEKLKVFKFIPSKLFLVTNDLLKSKFEGKNNSDAAVVENDIIKTIINVIDSADRIYYNSLTFSPVPAVLSSIKKFLERGGKFNLFTNEEEHFKSAFKGIDLLSEGAENKSVRFFNKLGFLKSQESSISFDIYSPRLSKYKFIHRKLLLTDKWLLTGSDNFSYASTFYCDEILIAFQDPRLVSFFEEEHKSDMKNNFYLNLKLKSRFAEDEHYVTRFLFGLLEPVLYDLVL